MNNNLISFVKSVFSLKTIFPIKSSIPGGNIFLISIWFLITFTVLSGSVRKWLTGPGVMSNLIFLIQLLLPLILYYFTSKAKIKSTFTTPIFFLIFILYIIIAAVNPKNQTIYHGIFGIVIHLGFWILLLTYYKLRLGFEIEKFTNFMVLILIGEVVLGSIQYSLPGSHFLNTFSTGEDNTAGVGEAIRVSGTFSFLGGFQALVIFYGFFIWFLLVRKYSPIIIFIVFGVSLFAGLLSGSRGSVGFLLIISAFAFIYTGFLFKFFLNTLVSLCVLGFLLFYLGGSFVSKFDNAYTNFLTRINGGYENNKELEGRVVGSYTEIFDFKGMYPVYGIGLGSTYQGANALFGESVYAKQYGYYESELGRVVIEGGYILLFLRITLFLVMIRFSFIPFIGKVLIFILFLNSMIVFNTYLGVFFFLGIIFVDRAYYLEAPLSIKNAK